MIHSCADENPNTQPAGDSNIDEEPTKPHLLSNSDICYLIATFCIPTRPASQKFRRCHAVILLKLAAKMGKLFEAQFRGHFFDGTGFNQKQTCSNDPLFIQPILRASTHFHTETAFKLALGDLKVA